MKAKILLITPNFKSLKGGIKRIQPPAGIGFLAEVLLRENYEVIIRDTALEGYENEKDLTDELVLVGETDEQIADFIKTTAPNVVGISAMFTNLVDSAKNTAKIVKNLFPQVPIVVGGNHVTNAARDYQFAQTNDLPALSNLFEDLIFDKNIDYAMLGEAEYEFPKLVDCLLNNGDISLIKNLVYKNENEVIFNSPPLSRDDKRMDIENLPAPAWHLFNMKKYSDIGVFQSS
ncbi:MAG: cobalamin-dependent protein [Turicibacter sp.]|nr:cobalamin-dependent protein [Turicibacter sp.]